MVQRTWYVEVTRTQRRFGYVGASSRQEAIEIATDFDGDRDGLTTHVDSWEVQEAYRSDGVQDRADGAIEIS